MRNLARGAEALKEGAIVVTTTDPLPSAAFEVVEEVRSVFGNRCPEPPAIVIPKRTPLLSLTHFRLEWLVRTR